MDIPLQWQVYGIAVAIFIAFQVAGLLIVWAAKKYAKPRAEKSKSTLDERLLAAAITPVRFAAFILGLQFGLFYVDPAGVWLGYPWSFWFGTLAIVWAANFLSNFINAFLAWYYYELSEAAKRKHIGLSDDVIPIFRRLVKIVVYSLAIVMVLGRFGVDIGPILATLGLAGLAVALALKDTLENFFAGVYLLTEKPIRQGEYITVIDEENQVSGQVLEVGWSSTRLLADDNTEYYVPNEKVTQCIVHNHSRGESGEWKGATLTVTVPRENDADVVEAILVRSLRKVEAKDKRFTNTQLSGVKFGGVSGDKFVYSVTFAVNDPSKRLDASGTLLKQILSDLRVAGVAGA